MNISGASSLDAYAEMATGMQNGNLSLKLSTAVLKKTLEMQAQQGEALIAMMKSSSLTGTGQNIDIRA